MRTPMLPRAVLLLAGAALTLTFTAATVPAKTPGGRGRSLRSSTKTSVTISAAVITHW